MQPDIIVSCGKDKRTALGIYGAPDMCVEIISPSSRKRDYGPKMMKYMNAGVREYWIVDLRRETALRSERIWKTHKRSTDCCKIILLIWLCRVCAPFYSA